MKKLKIVLFITLLLFIVTNIIIKKGIKHTIIVSSIIHKSPISINTIDDLDIIRNNLDGDYILSGDIDLKNIDNFIPIGSLSNPFTGTFDGAGFKISGLNINLPTSDYVGLFAVNYGTITDVGIINSNIVGNTNVASIAGFNNGTISEVYSSANVRGNKSIGAIAGQNFYEILNSYNTGNISGNASVGGITGYNTGLVKYTYNLGNITGALSTGSLVGQNIIGSSLENSIYIEGFFNAVGNGGNETNVVKKTNNEMQIINSYNNFDIANIWEMSLNSQYPYMVLKNNHHEEDLSNPVFSGGNGKLYNPFQITNQNQLSKISDFNSGSYILMNDIKLDESFSMIKNIFYGNFNGNSKYISAFSSNTKGLENIGLFSYNNGIIQNIGVINANVIGNKNVGIIVGFNDYGIISECYTSGNILGTYNTGGIIGYNNIGKIINSFNISNIEGEENVGGIIGNNYEGSIQNVYNIGNIIGQTTNIGGIAGINNSGIIINAYHVLSKGVGGGPDTTTQSTLNDLLNQSTYSGFDFSGIWAIDTTKAINSGYAYLQGMNYIRVTGIDVPVTEVEMLVNDTYQVIANIVPNDALNKNIAYEIISGNDKISINSAGLITALNPGVAVVKVTTEDGGYSEEITITVIPRDVSILKNILILDKNGTVQALTPTFESAILTYNIDTLIVNNSDLLEFIITKFNPAQTFILKNITTGTNGTNNTIDIIPGINVIELIVANEELTDTTTYTFILKRAVKDTIALNDLVITDKDDNPLTISPLFDTNIINYNLELNSSLGNITITTTPNDPLATVSINGVPGYSTTIDLSDLNIGENEILIKIEKDGEEQIYHLNITINDSSNSNLTDLKIFDENDLELILDPIFSSNIYTYNIPVFLDKDNELIKIEYEKESKISNVTIKNITTNQVGNPLNVIPGQNIIEITVTSEDETNTSIYRITLIREIDSSVLLENIIIKDQSNNDIPLNPIFDSHLVTYELVLEQSITELNIEAITKDNTAKIFIDTIETDTTTIDVNDLIIGTTTLTIEIKNNDKIQIYTIDITRNAKLLIESDVYEIDRENGMELGYMFIKPDLQVIDDLLPNINNPSTYLVFMDQSENEITDTTDKYIGTGTKIQLVINSTVHDELIIILWGDVDGNGSLNSTDVTRITNYLRDAITFDEYQEVAANVKRSGEINSTDVTRLRNHLRDAISIYE